MSNDYCPPTNYYDPTTTIFAGMDRTALQAWLTRLQTAYLTVASGGSVQVASYTQGDGAKSVTYNQANLANLVALIKQLQAQLGIIANPRRPTRFAF